MIYRKHALILAILLLLAPKSVIAHKTEPVHPGITTFARDLISPIGYDEVGRQFYEREGNCNDLLEGSAKEDNILNSQTLCGVMPLSWLEHCYNPINGRGWRWGFGDAVSKAITEYGEAADAYNKCDKSRAYFQLGRVIHLLEDMTSPAHVHSDVHPLGDDFETWAAIQVGQGSYLYEPFAIGSEIVEPTSLANHFHNLALKTYNASSFQAVLYQSETNPIDRTSELGRMFPEKVTYVSYGLWGVSYWVIKDIGEYEAEFASDDWWQCEDDPGYYYIENANGDRDVGIRPTEMRTALTNRFSPMGPNNETIMTRWAQDLFPITVDYSSGLMKYFYDQMHGNEDGIAPGKPTGLKARSGNGSATLTWSAPVQDKCGDTLADLRDYRVYYSTNLGTLNNSGGVTASTPFKTLTGLVNNKTYFVCVAAVDSRGNESECSDPTTVSPLGGNTRWVHQVNGPPGSYTTIRAALDGAPRGTTVMVGEGRYEEDDLQVGTNFGLGWNPEDITVRSERGPGNTTIINSRLRVSDRSRVIGFTFVGNAGITCVFSDDSLIANNIFIANETGITVSGTGFGDRFTKIVNNVFKGNTYAAIEGMHNWGTQVFNNIFQGNENVIVFFAGYGVAVAYNDLVGNRNDLSNNHDFIVRTNYRCDPAFDEIYQPRSSCGVDRGSPVFSYLHRPWRDCDATRADLGAYGGPFAYADKDGNGLSDCAQLQAVSSAVAMVTGDADRAITLQVQEPIPSELPDESQALLDLNPLEETLTYRIVMPPSHGTLSGTPPDLRYSPDPGFVGEDSFTFTVADEIAESAPATVSITVKASNEPPAALDQTLTQIPYADGLYVVLQGTDADVDPLTFTIDSTPTSGSLVCLDQAVCYFTPAAYEPVSFTFHVSDGIADSAPATVTLAVNIEPTISLLTPAAGEPATNGSLYSLMWLDADPNSSSLISFYLDTDGAGYNGTLVAADIPEDDPSDSLELDISRLTDGTHYFYAIIQDEWSSARTYAPGPLVIDRTPPVVTIQPVGGMYRTPQTVILAVDEPATIHITTDGTSPGVLSPAYQGPIPVNDRLMLRWTAVDAAGNQSAESSATFVIDSALPTVGINPLPDPLRQPDLLLTGIMEPGATVTLAVDQPAQLGPVAHANASWSCWVVGLANGPVTFTATAVDAAGNLSSTTLATTVDLNRAPTVPVIFAPPIRSETTTLQPALKLENSTDADGNALSYEFEVYSGAGLTQFLCASGPVAETVAYTSWTVSAALADNTRHWWRARACDGSSCSDWTEVVDFFVNLANDPPGTFAVSEPQDNTDVAALAPVLGVNNSTDPDGDTVRYSFLVYEDPEMTRLAAASAAVPAGQGGGTSWIVSPPLNDNTWYFWKVVAADEHGAATETGAGSFFVNLTNEKPSKPGIKSPPDGGEWPSVEVTLTVVNAIDPDYDALSYFFELDTADTFDGPDKVVSESITEGSGTTSWPLTGLSDNTRYHWRVLASDGLADSGWTTGAFFTNTANDPPSAVIVQSPGAGSWVDSVTPRLQISPAVDPDRDPLVYGFQISTTPAGIPAAQGRTAETFWIPGQALADNTWHFWRAAATDVHGLTGPWSEPSPFFVNDNNIDDPPSITVTEPRTDYLAGGGIFTIAWADADPDTEADIALYRDDDNAGADGVLIVAGLSEDPDGADDNYQWDLGAVPSGTWWIYGVIGDATSARVSYSPGTVTVDHQAPMTNLSPPPGTYTGPVTVSMSASDDRDPSPAIHYTTDGSAPTLQSARYTAPITLAQTTTLRYFAVDSAGVQEPVRGPAVYTVQAVVTVVAPNGGETIEPGKKTPIVWVTNADVQRVDKVILSYSTNSGSTWKKFATLKKNPGTYSWPVPAKLNSATCRVRVQLYGNRTSLGRDTSDEDFSVGR